MGQLQERTPVHQHVDEMVLVVIPHAEHVLFEEHDAGMFVTLRLVRYQDVINGLYTAPTNRDARLRFITDDMKPTLRSIGLLQGEAPTGNEAVVQIAH